MSMEDQSAIPWEHFWHPNTSRSANTYVAFRATFELASSSQVDFQMIGAHWFRVWLDGEFITEGPARFDAEHPEYESLVLSLTSGFHVIAILAHNENLNTRIIRGDIIPPFMSVKAIADSADIRLHWKCLELSLIHI